MVTSFTSIIGQNQAIELLTQAVARQRIAPAYLFVGTPGIGRGLTAQCFIELLFSNNHSPANPSLKNRIHKRNHPDLLWVEPTYLHQGKLLSAKEATEAGVKRKSPPQIRLEQVREISEFLGRPPLETARSVVVLQQAETMRESAANGLLKTLEEPGKRATLILIAPGVDSLLPTLVSRCQRIPFYRLANENMKLVLEKAGHEEILRHKEVMMMAQGSPGEAIAAWQQLQEIPADILETVTQGIKTIRQALEVGRDISKNLDMEAQLWLIDYLQHSYWAKQQQQLDKVECLKHLEAARKYLLSYVQPRLVWECTFMAMCSV
ncbi:MAG: DNA polymerase III subunit delta' [Okeania sp. SIO1H6]|uniref:DNA polymerase III subunit delta n=1 Tax=Okeania hirsuta TaxID=1458930 RepID=A0A3N6P543_9CYAN|nr:DNA polymerase III subunit delta' [Okeania sp. SIO1H4]NES90530.1 DNA polymerase III subunit delta' [Okeania sp. SIO2B9]NET15358.1 DNA polymerase III subunit delta' [Okeania sp. SIO1H6]NET18356.1 DNA polymerase III subunit delta' [Okeania sp. SIO1H5]NET75968.1 DNA polymerase III subunit delta' [Okeania sp. SIO1F9]NET92215.1 DNA polymerase III subunit delta' [Okeania sp. SIO1H2]RQH17551.1 DNA polymerase III subunit delta' [Okeania hirsuta]